MKPLRTVVMLCSGALMAAIVVFAQHEAAVPAPGEAALPAQNEITPLTQDEIAQPAQAEPQTPASGEPEPPAQDEITPLIQNEITRPTQADTQAPASGGAEPPAQNEITPLTQDETTRPAPAETQGPVPGESEPPAQGEPQRPAADETAAPAQASPVLPTQESVAEPALPVGDAARGRLVFGPCRTCHYAEESMGHNNGPNLHRIFGKVAGKQEGFNYYSDEFKAAQFVWTPALMYVWLENPMAKFPASSMMSLGVPDPQQRADLIEFLKQASEREP